MSDLAEFLLARVSEEAAIAQGTAKVRFARATEFRLAECEAKRCIVQMMVDAEAASRALSQDEWRGGGPRLTSERWAYGQTAGSLREVGLLLAQPYASHPDFQTSWSGEVR